ncbi:MAG: signal recognition particle-docking protein FtsY [Actinomycetota bacterium]
MPIVILIVVVLVVLAVVAGIAVRRRRPAGPSGAVLTRPTFPDAAAAPTAPASTSSTSSEGLGVRVRALFGAAASDDERWSGLEDLLVRADVGPKGAAELVVGIKSDVGRGADPEDSLVAEISAVLGEGPDELDLRPGKLGIVMVVGVNGSGKTTTIGKLSRMLADKGMRVTLAASDTFRAAAGEQLETWADRAGAHLVGGQRGADPAAVAFDGYESAKAKGSDVLIVDTAGRLHTKTPLMEELAKVKRVLEKAAGSVQEVLLVLDATTGQNGIAQARAFTDSVGVTGVVLTKMDGSAKGGIVIAVREELGVPVKLVGTGEGVGDLEAFDPSGFAERLVRG